MLAWRRVPSLLLGTHAGLCQASALGGGLHCLCGRQPRLVESPPRFGRPSGVRGARGNAGPPCQQLAAAKASGLPPSSVARANRHRARGDAVAFRRVLAQPLLETAASPAITAPAGAPIDRRAGTESTRPRTPNGVETYWLPLCQRGDRSNTARDCHAE